MFAQWIPCALWLVYILYNLDGRKIIFLINKFIVVSRQQKLVLSVEIDWKAWKTKNGLYKILGPPKQK